MAQDQMMNKVLVTIKTQEKNGSEREMATKYNSDRMMLSE